MVFKESFFSFSTYLQYFLLSLFYICTSHYYHPSVTAYGSTLLLKWLTVRADLEHVELLQLEMPDPVGPGGQGPDPCPGHAIGRRGVHSGRAGHRPARRRRRLPAVDDLGVVLGVAEDDVDRVGLAQGYLARGRGGLAAGAGTAGARAWARRAAPHSLEGQGPVFVCANCREGKLWLRVCSVFTRRAEQHKNSKNPREHT